MNIGIDARMYGIHNRGLGRYVMELTAGLERIDSENQYSVFLRKNNWDEYTPSVPNFAKKLWDVPWYTVREQCSLCPPQKGLNVMHFPHWNVPRFQRYPYIVTIHDLILFDFPSSRATTRNWFAYKIKYAAFKWLIGQTIKRADAIIAVSNATANAIRAHFPRVSNISVIHEGAPLLVAPQAFDLGKRGIKKRYILYVGAVYPHKNVGLLLRAFAIVQKTQDIQLVLIGRKDFFYERLEREAVFAGNNKNVVFFGEARDAELVYLYQNAIATVAPSLVEGFAFGALESMVVGTPVLASRIPCFEEVLKDGAMYFDPHSADDCALKLLHITNDSGVRLELIQKGKTVSGQYSWDRTAQETKELYLQFDKQ